MRHGLVVALCVLALPAAAASEDELWIERYMSQPGNSAQPTASGADTAIMIESYGTQVFASPSDRTHYGRALLEGNADAPGPLGIAISEAVEAAAASGGTKKYSLGSVLNHVLMHQSVIGLETLQQFEMADEYPDVIIGCTGGGSNFAGFAFPFIHKNLTEGKTTRVIATEPAASPSLTKGVYTFDYGDTAQMAPVVKMHTLGHTFTRRASMPVACATTAWPRRSARWSTAATSRRELSMFPKISIMPTWLGCLQLRVWCC